MKRKILAIGFIAAMLAASVVVPAQDVGAAVFTDLHGQTSVVAGSRIGTLYDIAGKRGWRADVLAFAGLDAMPKRPIVGFAVAFNVRAAANASVNVGPALAYSDGRVRSGGVYAGFSFTL